MLDKTLVGGKDPMAFLFSGAKTGYLAEWNPRTGRKRLPGSEATLNDDIQLSPIVVSSGLPVGPAAKCSSMIFKHNGSPTALTCPSLRTI